MVYVQTTKDLSCTIKGDNIEIWNEDFVKITNKDGKVVGLFDIGSIVFMYHTEPKHGKD